MFAYVTKRETKPFSMQTMKSLFGQLQLHRYAFYAMYQRMITFFKGVTTPFPMHFG